MSAPARVAVVGPGAVGGAVAGWLIEQGHDVTLCVRTRFDLLRVSLDDAVIEHRPRVIADPADAEPADWVLVCTKAYDVDGAARWLRALGGSGTRVAILQNGVEHRTRFADIVAPDRMVPVIVDIPAERSAPGVVLQRRAGSMVVPDDAAGRAFVALFSGTPIAVSATSDFATVAWRKLALNCAGAVNALTLRSAEIAHNAEVAAVMHTLASECAAVGRAEGANLAEDLPDEVVRMSRAAAPESLNSLHADRLAGRPMEIDARNGVIVRLGEKHGIATPLNRAIVALLSAAGARD